MIDERFALSAFESHGQDKISRRALADVLQDEVAQELSKVIVPAMNAIIERLNRLGHNLRPYGPPEEPGNLAFRDDDRDDAGYDCKLRVACDCTISTGYRDVRFSRSNPEGMYPDEVRDQSK